MASPKDSLVFWPSTRPQWLIQAPTFETNPQAPDNCLHILKHDDCVRTCMFSPDGHLAVTGSDDAMVRVWDVATGTLQHVFEALDTYVYSLAMSRSGPQGRPLLAACGSEVIMVWDLSTGEMVKAVKGVSRDVRGTKERTIEQSVRPQDDHDVAQGDGAEAKRAEADEETSHNNVSETNPTFIVGSIDISPQGDRLVALTWYNIILWEMPSFKATVFNRSRLSKEDEDNRDMFRNVKFSPDGRLIAASFGRFIIIQDLSTGEKLRRLPSHASHFPKSTPGKMDLDPEQEDDARSSRGQPEGSSSKITAPEDEPGHSGNIDGLCFSPENGGKTFPASGSDDGTARIWNLRTGETEVVLKYHTEYVNGVSFSPDGSLVATASTDSTIGIWKQRSPGDWGSGVRTQPDQVLLGHTSMVWSIDFAPRRNLLVSAGNDSEARIWEVNVLERAEQLETDDQTGHDIGNVSSSPSNSHDSPVVCISMSPDGKTIASGCTGGEIRFWDGISGAWLRTMEGKHESSVISLVFSDDGETLVSTSVDESALVWSVKGDSMRPRLRLVGHGDWVRCAAISIDGSLAATASDDWAVRLWDISSPANPTMGASDESTSIQPVAKLSGHEDFVNSVAFSPDSRQLASVSDDSRVMLWDITFYEGHMVPKIEMTEDGSRLWQDVVFTPDSNFVLTVSEHGDVAIWKPNSFKENQCLGIYKAASPFTTMRMVKNKPNTLFTDSGIWLFETNLPKNGTSPEDSRQLDRPADSGLGFSSDNSCITWNGSKLILLPMHFRPNGYPSRWVQGRCAVVGCKSGQVHLFRLSEKYDPPSCSSGQM